MNSGIFKMLVPQILKRAEDSDTKKRLIGLINEKKFEMVEKWIEEEGLDGGRWDYDAVLVIGTTSEECIVRVMVQDRRSREIVGVCGIYRYEDIISSVKKAL